MNDTPIAALPRTWAPTARLIESGRLVRSATGAVRDTQHPTRLGRHTTTVHRMIYRGWAHVDDDTQVVSLTPAGTAAYLLCPYGRLTAAQQRVLIMAASGATLHTMRAHGYGPGRTIAAMTDRRLIEVDTALVRLTDDGRVALRAVRTARADG